MAKFKYLGPSGVFVGRFGRLKKGDVVSLWQSEAEYVLANSSDTWSLVTEKSDDRGVGSIIPALTSHFDLTRIFWLKEAYSSIKRMSRAELLSVGRALLELGAVFPKEDVFSTYSREALIEEIHGEVKRLKWDQPGYGPEVAGEDSTYINRARKGNGRFKADDPTTPDVNEAWEGGVSPKDAEAATPEDPKPEEAPPVEDSQGESEPAKSYREIRRTVKRKPKNA